MPCVVYHKVCRYDRVMVNRRHRVRGLIQPDAWPGVIPSVVFSQERGYQLRFSATASRDSRAWLISPMTDTGAELPGDNWSDYAGARLFQNGVSRFIKRTRFSLVFAATVASEERDKARLNNPQRMTIPAGEWTCRRSLPVPDR